jgi:alpha-D-ribose 1-methylphosphonate 5-triphosphate diphosphatase PhnM
MPPTTRTAPAIASPAWRTSSVDSSTAAATSAPAAALGLPDRGTFTSGLRADLLLVDGDPELDITATRRVAQVWRAGRPAR